MKWTIEQLRKLSKDLYLEEELKFSKDEYSDFKDIIDIKDTSITGTVMELTDDQFMFSLNIKSMLVLSCAVTLEEINYPLDFTSDLIFAKDFEMDDDVYFIDGITISLIKPVLSEIILRKPTKVVKEGSENIYISSEEHLSKEVGNVKNDAFSALDNFFDEK